MRRTSLKLVGLILLIAGLPLPALTADFQVKVQPTRYPFLPTLSLNQNPELCGAFLDLVTDEFLGTRFEIGVIDRPWQSSEVSWVIGGPNDEPNYVVDSAEVYDRRVDINGDGVIEALVEVVTWPNWRSQQHSLVWFPSSIAYDYFVARVPSPYDISYDILGKSSRSLFESWIPLGVASYGRDLFVYDAGVYQDFERSTLLLRRIGIDGELTPTCIVEILPTLPRPRVVHGLASLDEMYNQLSRIIGVDPKRSCGTSSFSHRLQRNTVATRSRAIYRPWALTQSESGSETYNEYYLAECVPYNSRTDVDAYLMNWGYESLSQFREWRQLTVVEDSAAAVLAVYYQHEFGLDREVATNLGKVIADRILRAHFVFPRVIENNLDALDVQSMPTDERMSALKSSPPVDDADRESLIAELLRRAALEGRTDDIEWLLQSEVSPDTLGFSEWGDPKVRITSGETPLFAALEHPEVVKLLINAGADVNHRNGFGKTALMYAAQYDLIDSARLLLAAKADPNLATEINRGWSYAVSIGDRTALMYAAENASVEMMQLLIDSGADRNAKDSAGRAVEEYFHKNTYLSGDEVIIARRVIRGQVQ